MIESTREAGCDDFSYAMKCFYVTCLLVTAGVVVGAFWLRPPLFVPYGELDLWQRFAAWDGGQYMEIATVGYMYEPDKISNAAFFPTYPLLGYLVSRFSGLAIAPSLWLVSNVCLAFCFLVFQRYVALRFPGNETLRKHVLLVFALFPTTFFFRMAYSESLFLLLCLLTMYGIEKKWSVVGLALLIGCSTATRGVGVCLILPLLMHAIDRFGWTRRTAIEVTIALPLCVSGLVGFMLYQWHALGDPMCFMKAQDNYRLQPKTDLLNHLLALVEFQPIWANYLPESPAYWRRHSPAPSVWLNLQFANPIYWLLTCITIVAGFKQRLLNKAELALAFGLIAVPYLARSTEFCMASQARYVSIVYPAYLVWGWYWAKLPALFVSVLASLSALLLVAYASLFSAWYFFV